MLKGTVFQVSPRSEPAHISCARVFLKETPGDKVEKLLNLY